MTTINVPQPGICPEENGIYYADDALVDKRAQLHELHLGPISLQDGTVLAQSDISSAYFLFTRYDLESPGVVEKIWSTSNKKWDLPANIPDKDRDKNVLLFTDDATYPWKGQFVLIAEEGKFKSPLTIPGFPKYTLECYFTSRPINNKIYAGKSAPSIRIIMGTFPPVFKDEIVISHESGAKIKIDSSGNISLTPSSSGKVNITGNVDISDSLTVNGNLIA